MTAIISDIESEELAPLSRFQRVLDLLQMAAVIWLLFTGMWSGPSIGATLAYPNGLLEVEAGLAVLLILRWLLKGQRYKSAYPFLWPSAAVILLCSISASLRITYRGTELSSEAMSLWQHGEPILRGLLLFLAIAGRRRILRLAWFSMLAGMTVQAGAAILQHVTHVSRWYADLDAGWKGGWKPTLDSLPTHNLPPPPRVQGMTSYANLAAAMLAASLPAWVVPLALRIYRSVWPRLVLLAGGIMTAAALWYTGSRGPILAVGITAIICLYCLSPRWRFSLLAAIGAFLLTVLPSTPWWALAAFLLSIVLAFFAQRHRLRYLIPGILALCLAGGIQTLDAYVFHYQLSWRLSESGLEDDARLLLWDDAVYAVKTSPWWGVGDASAAENVIRLASPGLRRLPATQRNFHNQYLHWAAAEGIPVAIAFTLLVLWVVLCCWRIGFSPGDPFSRMLGLAAGIGLTAFLICNLVDAHFWRIEGGGFFWSLAAVAAAAEKTEG